MHIPHLYVWHLLHLHSFSYWILFLQLAVFRSLLFTSAEDEIQKSMVNNFRVQQPLCGRTVRSSFLQKAASEEANKNPH